MKKDEMNKKRIFSRQMAQPLKLEQLAGVGGGEKAGSCQGTGSSTWCGNEDDSDCI